MKIGISRSGRRVIATLLFALGTLLAGAPVSVEARGGPNKQTAMMTAQEQSPEMEEARRLIDESIRLYKEGRFDEGIAASSRALEIYERLFGPEHKFTAVPLMSLALLYAAKQDYARAEPTYIRLLSIKERVLGADNPDIAHILSLAAEACQNNGHRAKAEELFQRALSLREKAFGGEGAEVLVSLVKLGDLYQAEDEYSKAEPLYLRAVAVAEKLGPENENIAVLHNNLGEMYRKAGRYAEAEPHIRQSLALGERLLGPDAPLVAAAWINLGNLYTNTGKFREAEQAYARALSIQEKRRGAESLEAAQALNNLGNLYKEAGDYAKSESHLKRALAIKERALGAEHPSVATTLGNLADLYTVQADFRNAELLYQRVLAIREKTVGADSLAYADALNNLAGLYEGKGDYVKAEVLYQRALGTVERRLGPEHPRAATALNNLASLYKAKGDYAKARALYERSYSISLKALGPEHPDVALSLNNMAMIYDRGTAADSEALLQRALPIIEKAYGLESLTYASLLDNLAGIYSEEGRTDEAEVLHSRALALRTKLLGPTHPDVAMTLINLAYTFEAKGDYAGAETSLRQALSIFEKSYGTEHPYYAAALGNLSSVYLRKGDTAHAVETLARTNEINERLIALNLVSGSEQQKLHYLKTFAGEYHAAVALHMQLAPKDPAALRLALLSVLRRKGRALDEMADTVGTLRRLLDARGRELLDQLAEARTRLATLVLKGPGLLSPAEHQARVKRADEDVESLSAEVSRRSAVFRLQSLPVTLETVRASIPSDAALVEIVSYPELNLGAKTADGLRGAERYAAYVLRPDGEMLSVELGDAATINTGVSLLRAALRDETNRNVKQLGRELDEKVMRPVRRLLGGTRHVLVSPDGELNLVPFAALVDEDGRYLLESYSFTYLTSGRDLLRRQTRLPSRGPTVVIANPEFNQAISAGPPVKNDNASDTEARLSGAFKEQFGPLEGTAVEARELGKLLPNARVLTGSAAKEGNVKRLSGPTVLHVATHGFFLDNQKIADSAGGKAPAPTPVFTGVLMQPAVEPDENPLLRSGLAFAGANRLQGGDGEDGVLTAFEVAGLDLWGTRLVVLSACETGLGEVQNGEGVYGLRRSLVLAGAESSLMSLWKVHDEVTAGLMLAYYEELRKGGGRGEALRRTQLRMLQSEDQRHPYFWAGFIQSGDWTSLEVEDR